MTRPEPDSLAGEPLPRDTAEQRALRKAFNARLDQLQQDVQALVRFCPEKDRKVGARLLELARCLVRDAKLQPGAVGALARAAKKDRRQRDWSESEEQRK